MHDEAVLKRSGKENDGTAYIPITPWLLLRAILVTTTSIHLAHVRSKILHLHCTVRYESHSMRKSRLYNIHLPSGQAASKTSPIPRRNHYCQKGNTNPCSPCSNDKERKSQHPLNKRKPISQQRVTARAVTALNGYPAGLHWIEIFIFFQTKNCF
jgi:hypothetical protein